VQSQLDIAELEASLETARALARTYAADVRAHFGDRTRRIRLYGSAARGDWTTESDVDVLVLLDTVAMEDQRWLVDRATDLGIQGCGILLQPLPLAEDHFNELRELERLFAQDVEREGVEL